MITTATDIITVMDTTIDNKTYDIRCADCFRKSYDRLLEKFDIVDIEIKAQLHQFLYQLLQEDNYNSPEIQQRLGRCFTKLTGIKDAFAYEKRKSNQLAEKLYMIWKPKVIHADDPFQLALRLAIAGNIIDYGVHHPFDLETTIGNVLHSNLAVDHSRQLAQSIKSAQKILYLCDNTGEIYFDKLLIETIDHPNLTAVVRGFPTLNDATTEDAIESGLTDVCPVVHNGSDAPSTLLHDCSPEFLGLFEEADLIISKGQGNLEGLLPLHDTRIFFLLMAKCEVIAEALSVQKGDLVVYHSH